MSDPRRCYDCPECHRAEFGVRRCFFLAGRYSRRFRQDTCEFGEAQMADLRSERDRMKKVLADE